MYIYCIKHIKYINIQFYVKFENPMICCYHYKNRLAFPPIQHIPMDVYKIVASTFALVAQDIRMQDPLQPGVMQTSSSPDIHNKKCIIYKNEQIILAKSTKSKGRFTVTPKPTKYFESLFVNYSLTDLRNVLYLLFPNSTNYVGSDNKCFANTINHVKFTIKYIEKEISLQSSNNNNNSDDKSDNSNTNDYSQLVKRNQQLQNEYDALKNKYDAMIYIMNT